MDNLNNDKVIDMHLHTKSSFDAKSRIEDILQAANNKSCSYIAITDHNSLNEIDKYYKKLKADKRNVYVQVGSVKVVAGTEVTSKLNINYQTNKTVHLLVYGPKNLKNSLIGKLIDLKRLHDNKVNYDVLHYIENQLNVKFTEQQIKEYIEIKKQNGKKFERFDRQDVLNINKRYAVISNRIKLEETLKNYRFKPYLSLNAKDVIEFAHKSDAICLIAHPSINLNNKYLQETGAKALAQYGIDGAEIDYNKKDRTSNNIFFSQLSKYSTKQLITSAGSDNHDILNKRYIGRTYYKKLYEKDYIIANYAEKLQERVKTKAKILADKYSYVQPLIKSSEFMNINKNPVTVTETLYFQRITPMINSLNNYKNISQSHLMNNQKTLAS